MAGGETLSERRERFLRETAQLLGTSLDAIQTWEAFLKLDKEAMGLLHDARTLRANYTVHFAARGIQIESGSALQIRQEFEKYRGFLTDFRGKLVAVKERLHHELPASSTSPVLEEARNLGMPPELATAYERLDKRINEIDPNYGPMRKAAAKKALQLLEAHQEFEAVFEKYFPKASVKGADNGSVEPVAIEIPSSGHVTSVCNGNCPRYDGAKAILGYLRESWEVSWKGRTTLHRLMKSTDKHCGPIPVQREGRYLSANQCRLDAWAALLPRK